MASLRFTRQDAALFSSASHDRNPLHMSELYARKTPYGQPVIFGMLAALAGVGKLPPRRGSSPASLDIRLQNAVFADIDYDLSLDTAPDMDRARLTDGRRVLMTASIKYRTARSGKLTTTSHVEPLSTALVRETSDFAAGRAFAGKWSPDRAAFDQLRDRWHLDGKGGDERHHAALLLASYAVGMDLPGQQALFSQMTLDFDPDGALEGDEFEYRLAIAKYQPVFKLLILNVDLRLGARRFAAGEIRVFVRDATGVGDGGREDVPAGQALQGKVACVVGGSRGLGADIVAALARQGCRVIVNFAKSVDEAERLRNDLRGAPGEVVLAQGDAGSAGTWERIREQVIAPYGRLDLLVCNACPPLLPLWVEPPAVQRIQEHVTQSLAMALAPLATSIELLARSSGWLVLVSSAAVKNPVAEWPHYAAAKGALEALVTTAAVEYPEIKCLIARPSRLRTELTNTPLGRKGALASGAVATSLVQWLVTTRSHTAGQVEYLEF